MVEGVVALDSEQGILFANDRAVSCLNWPRSSPVGRGLWEVVRQRPCSMWSSGPSGGAKRNREEMNWSGDNGAQA